MNGEIKVVYTIVCNNELYQEIAISELLQNEKISKLIKSEFAKGLRNVDILQSGEAIIVLKTQKAHYEFIAQKDDFADLLVLAEEDARKHRRIRKDCEAVELLDITTLE